MRDDEDYFLIKKTLNDPNVAVKTVKVEEIQPNLNEKYHNFAQII